MAAPRVSATTRSISDGERSCKYIPLRLDEEERRMLNILENALEVSEYTDVVDVTFSHLRTSKSSRILTSLVDTLAISCGLIMSNNLSDGESLLEDKQMEDNVPLFAEIFEVGRRYKIMNPGKLRDTYGKLMYLLMDAKEIKWSVGDLQFINPIKTVFRFLEGTDAQNLMNDPLLIVATQVVDSGNLEVIAGGDGEKMEQLRAELATKNKAKSEAVASLISRYTSKHTGENSVEDEKEGGRDADSSSSRKRSKKQLSPSDIERVIQSIADNQSFLHHNVSPVENIIELLEGNFTAAGPSQNFSLELRMKPKKQSYDRYSSYGYGYGFSSSYIGKGACLSHSHTEQFTFVKQSMTLWKRIMEELPKLWIKADHDMLNNGYRLADTGQGYQRLQSCPKVGECMRGILSQVQRSFKEPWVGLSVVHLGDRDVPNALMFIDKYTQVPRILKPICQCIERLPLLSQDQAFHHYVNEEWGSIDGLRMQVLSDFFKHGFDGSGDDGGSCIDGRLTSSWNWCSKLHKKPYYHVFMFGGFQGFDGDWKQE